MNKNHTILLIIIILLFIVIYSKYINNKCENVKEKYGTKISENKVYIFLDQTLNIQIQDKVILWKIKLLSIYIINNIIMT